jgi:hypothetical protein
MKIGNLTYISTMLFVLFTGTALAEPRNGFGLNAGLASHSMDDPGGSYKSSGLSLGLDYQFVLSDIFSVSPFLMTSAETSDISGVSMGHGILGVQLRYWAGDFFFGGHLGGYSEVGTNGSISISANGSGAGLVAGWENHAGGLYFMGQLDSANLKYDYWDAKLSAFRFSVGYRWK